ncbi:outer membrane lipoprotein carrier protein LolA [Desulfarculus baarsii DSM 2075]|uniref:Outer membrane lipoprotein carrier protein LolA n=1 Tax=Desulfarculus baarsii (strain ATCC 33931 / DSM 2075 / LMG 7858 / VKM B-1802 / 2st14) TaxID=644282 RepID=E1QIR2_DESB2|nr:outer membrane lipoprotein carrier protein LolA [Desulfarculus baarsii]ADK84485.1 outer membrane lipoprotein carrier protein LolA [Desulfarculus baarsii DSM 2075]
MKKLIIAFVALAALCCPSAWAADDQAIQQRLSQRYGQVNGLAADFTRESQYVAAAGQAARKVRSVGQLVWVRPLNLRLTESVPKPQEVVSDGRTMWLIQPDRQRVTIYEVGDNTQALRGLLAALSGLSALDDSFKVVEATAEEQGPAGSLTVAMEPKEPRADMGRLVVWFAEGNLDLLGLRIVSMVGNINQYGFSNQRYNPDTSAGHFAYQPPEGWRVFDQRPVQRRMEKGRSE